MQKGKVQLWKENGIFAIYPEAVLRGKKPKKKEEITFPFSATGILVC